MKFEDYLDSLTAIKKLSPVKHTILMLLWQAGSDFPRDWVGSSSILSITGQKYFDRRVRELRDEIGCDIETKYIERLGEHGWRLNSPNLLNSNPREYLTTKEKAILFENFDSICQICGKKVSSGVRGLQADHKIPLSRGGAHELANWQPLCNNCNVGKRRACQGCNDNCQQCSWAFPEKTGLKIIVELSPELLSKLYELSNGSQEKLNEIVQDSIYKAISSSNC